MAITVRHDDDNDRPDHEKTIFAWTPQQYEDLVVVAVPAASWERWRQEDRALRDVERAARHNKDRLPECDCMGPGGMCRTCELGYALSRLDRLRKKGT